MGQLDWEAKGFAIISAPDPFQHSCRIATADTEQLLSVDRAAKGTTYTGTESKANLTQTVGSPLFRVRAPMFQIHSMTHCFSDFNESYHLGRLVKMLTMVQQVWDVA